MADTAIPGLGELNETPASNDELIIVDKSDTTDGASGTNKKITVANLSSSAGDVSKVGTPADNQVGVWTGDGTIEGDTNLTWSNADNRLNVGDPSGGVSGYDPQLFLPMVATQNILIDGRTNQRQVDTGVMRFLHTPAIENTRAVTYDVDANSLANTHATVVEFTATGLVAGEQGVGHDVQMDTANSTGGDLIAIEVSKTGAGSASVHGLYANTGVAPVTQDTGTITAIEQAWDYNGAYTDVTTNLGTAATDSTLFDANGDILYIGMASKFDLIEVVLATAASGAGIKPTFEFSAGSSVWTAFTPSDDTLGFRNSSVISWNSADLATWATDTVNGVGSKYWVRITRTQASLTTAPVEDTIKVQTSTRYQWNSSGNLNINNLTIAGTTTGIALDTASDVDTDKSKTPADGDVLTYDGTHWNAETPAGGKTLSADLVIGSTGDYATLGAAQTATAINNGDVIFLQPETITETGASTITATDLTIVGAGINGTSWATGTNDVTFSGARVRFKDIKVLQGAGSTIALSGADSGFSDCWLETSDLSTADALTFSGARAFVINSTLVNTDTTTSFQHCEFTTGSDGYKFMGNTIYSYIADANGIFRFVVNGGNIANNNIYPTTTPGSTSAVFYIEGENVSFTNNNFAYGGNSGYALIMRGANGTVNGNNFNLWGRAVSGTNSYGNVYSGNSIYTAVNDDGFVLTGERNLVQGNIFRSSSTTGTEAVLLTGTASDYNSFVGNLFFNYNAGVDLASSSNDFNFIHGNFFYNCTSDTANTGGANNVISDNFSA